ncbi:hypothetical protein HQN90_10215 [Paenibacillus alba]|uniref:LamG-like jellyroll fold domain-containing protein n=1 Tax=Paenibacillus alba TaxID=1197127 RepID=UPI0015672857|nr:LamG-like jellyroll fold domain-containing protein [Paenibacillus alba]NQX66499.1 hypothetical protein [Paenibacillus alba]
MKLKMKSFKKFFSVLLVVIMIASVPVSAMAEVLPNNTNFNNSNAQVTNPAPIIDLDMESLTNGKVINKADNKSFDVKGTTTALESGPEKFGKALRLDGTTNYINMGKEYQVTNEATIAAWVKMDTNPNGLSKIVSRARTTVQADSEIALYIRKPGGMLESGIATLLKADATDTIATGVWRHVAVTANKDYQIMYIDGVEVKRAAVSSFDKTWTTTDLLIGTGWNKTATAPFADHFLKGLLDEVKVYNVALSDKQIAALAGKPQSSDMGYWVINPVTIPSEIKAVGNNVVMTNGLVERVFSLNNNFMTSQYLNKFTGISLLDQQKLQADAWVTLDGKKFNIGGIGETASTFKYDSHMVENSTEKIFDWTYNPKISDPSMKDLPWPAKGKALIIKYVANANFENKYKGMSVQVRYEIYDGIPVISKKVTVTNNGEEDVEVTQITVEALPMLKQNKEMLYVESEFNAGNENHSRNNGRQNTIQYTNLNDTSVLMTSQYGTSKYPAFQTKYSLAKGKTFNGYKMYELFHSVDYYEWKTMEVKKMYRILFPQIGDNPTIFHLISNKAEVIKKEIDKASAVGFDMILSSFGSGVNIENVSETNIKYYKDIYDYAKQKDIMMGAYVVMSPRKDQPENEQYQGAWGTMRDMTSPTAERWYANVLKFIDQTGLKAIEIDGVYPNDSNGERTGSIVKQWERAIKKFNQDLRARNMYINEPDWGFLTGASKAVMGYEEIAFSQPRLEQLIYGRMVAYNGTFQKTPSMGWTLVPFSQYHAGGDDAIFMPSDKKIKDYDYSIALNFMSGIAGSFRGLSLYDSDTSKNVMSYWASFFNKYKEILNGDVVHIAPPRFKEGSNNQLTEDIDGIIHTSAQSEQKGMVVLYNQTGKKVTKKVKVPLYYTGLTDRKMPPAPVKGSHVQVMPKYGAYPPVDYYHPAEPNIIYTEGVPTNRTAVVSQGDINGKEYKIDSNGDIEIEVVMEPNSYAWYTVYDPNQVPQNMAVEIQAPKNVKVDSRGENQITISWDAVSVNGTKVKDYNVYKNGVYVDKVFETKFLDTNVAEGSEYSYEIVPVYNTVYGKKSLPLFVSTEKDSFSPEIEAVKANSDYTLDVVFNEKVLRSTAEMISNYTIQNNSISAAKLSIDGKSVALTVSNKIVPFIEHEIVVNNIKDISANANMIAANSKKVFKYGYLRNFAFDEQSGKIAIDNIHRTDETNGTISGDFPARLNGVKDKALVFDGTQTYVDIASVVDKRETFSIDGWFNPDDITKEQTIIGQQQDSYSTYRWNLYIDVDGKLKYLISDDSGENTLVLESGSHKVKSDKWNHFALVREANVFKLYLNGVLVDNESKPGIVQTDNYNAMFVGAYKNAAGGEPTRLFKGLMDEVTFYNVPVSNEFVVERFNRYSGLQ